MKSSSNQKGSVLIIVLWTSALLTVLVTAMAGAVRLSAITVSNNQDASIGDLLFKCSESRRNGTSFRAYAKADRRATRRN